MAPKKNIEGKNTKKETKRRKKKLLFISFFLSFNSLNGKYRQMVE